MKGILRSKLFAVALTMILAAGVFVPTQTVNAASGDAVVYITKTGKKYHADGCASLSKSKIQTTLSDAVSKGLESCSKCNPGALDGAADTKSVSTVQSTTTTKAATTAKSSTSAGFDTYYIPEQQITEDTFVLNKSSLKIHHPSCDDVPKIKPDNYDTSSESIDALITQGYSLCGHCFK